MAKRRKIKQFMSKFCKKIKLSKKHQKILRISLFASSVLIGRSQPAVAQELNPLGIAMMQFFLENGAQLQANTQGLNAFQKLLQEALPALMLVQKATQNGIPVNPIVANKIIITALAGASAATCPLAVLSGQISATILCFIEVTAGVGFHILAKRLGTI